VVVGAAGGGVLRTEEVVEEDDLVLQLEPGVVGLEEHRVLLLQLAPDELGELGGDLGLRVEGLLHLALPHVELQAPLNQYLDQRHVRGGDFLRPASGGRALPGEVRWR